MPIRYWEPLQEGFERMKGLLLRPFDLGTWFVLGFAAWLANLAGSGGSGATSRWNVGDEVRHGDWEGVAEHTFGGVREWLQSGFELAMVFTIAVFVLLLMVLVLWVSSRGQFIWLDNLIEGRPAIREPWTRWRHLGDSFFLWRLAFVLIVMVVMIPLALGSGIVGVLIGSDAPGPVSALFAVVFGALFFLILIAAVLIDFWAENYVTIIMRRQDLGVLAAWRVFLHHLQRQPGHFVLVGLFRLLLWLGVGAVILVASVVSCCLVAMVLAIPYLGTVLLLPVYASFRYFDLAWLGQIDPELATLPPRPPAGSGNAAMPPAPPSAPPEGPDDDEVRPG